MYAGDGGVSGGAPDARPSGGRRCTMRVARDSSGGMVLVYEADPSLATGPAALVFETTRGKVRLEHYPHDWRRLSDRELIVLSRR